MAVDSGKSGWVSDRFRAACAGDFMVDLTDSFRVGVVGEMIVNGDTLAEGLVNRLV